MFLTGIQVAKIAEISDGADVILKRPKGDPNVWITRVEDQLKVKISQDGAEETIDFPMEEPVKREP